MPSFLILMLIQVRSIFHIGNHATKDNYEITYSRGILKGEYIVNVHMYGPKPKNVVVPVNVVVSVKKSGQETRKP